MTKDSFAEAVTAFHARKRVFPVEDSLNFADPYHLVGTRVTRRCIEADVAANPDDWEDNDPWGVGGRRLIRVDEDGNVDIWRANEDHSIFTLIDPIDDYDDDEDDDEEDYDEEE